jgi:hypothetical protein
MRITVRNLVFAILFLCSTKGICSSVDTTLYTSTFEKQAFGFVEDSARINTLELFAALDFKANSIENIDQLKAYFKRLKKDTESMGLKKKLKYLYNKVHSDLLKHYTENAFFNDIFENGNYNCVTASALYGLLFKELGIDYIIKETEEHVYLIADPQNTSFLVETTSVTDGIRQFDAKVRAKYVEYLHGNKIITNEEFNSQSVDNLFAKYYTKDKTISLKQLAGIQYYNKGVFLYNDTKYKEALKNFEKALLLYNSDYIKYMTSNALLNLLSEEPSKKKFDGVLLAKYLNANKHNAEIQNSCMDHYNYTTLELAVNHPNIGALDRYYQDFVAFADTSNLEDYSNRYYSLKGYYYYTNGQFLQALTCLEKAYQTNPDNVTTKDLLKEALLKYLNPDKNNAIDPDSLEFYGDKISLFKNDKNFLKYKFYCYSRYIYDYCMANNFIKGDYYLYRFEHFLDINKDIVPYEEYIRIAYSEVENCYIRKYDYDYAIQLASEALKRLPNSSDLKERLSFLKRNKVLYGKNANESAIKFKTLKNILTQVKSHREEINPAIEKYLNGTWHWVLKEAPNKNEVNVTKGKNYYYGYLPGVKNGMNNFEEEQMDLTFVKSNELIISNPKESNIKGKWSYNNFNCTISLTSTTDVGNMYIVVNSISANNLKGIVYINDVNFKEVTLTK